MKPKPKSKPKQVKKIHTAPLGNGIVATWKQGKIKLTQDGRQTVWITATNYTLLKQFVRDYFMDLSYE